MVDNKEIYNPIGIDKNIKFGLEIEAENIKKNKIKGKYDERVWKAKTDPSLKVFNNVELSSIPFTDIKAAYKSINSVCHVLEKNDANVDENSSLQIHIDATIFNDDVNNLINFYKMWCIFENIIYRYSYGKDLRIRKTLQDYSAMIGQIFYDADSKGILFNNYDVQFTNGKMDKEIVNYSMIVGSLKRYGFSFRYYKNFGIPSLKTIEFRTMNGTLDIMLIKNYLKFFYSFLKYCCNTPDIEYINHLYNNTNLNENTIRNSLLVDYDKADILANMIYDNYNDREKFMDLYLKDNVKKLSRGKYGNVI